MPVIPAVRRLRQEDFEFEFGLHRETLSQKSVCVCVCWGGTFMIICTLKEKSDGETSCDRASEGVCACRVHEYENVCTCVRT
jgi:hypothetical protein